MEGVMPISGKEMLRRYLSEDWVVIRQNGSHVIVGKGSRRETIPVHGNKDLKNGLEKKLLKNLVKK
jgi:predicted RNA binding protein YcfA (HicA-like mRNA interferase family)